MIRGRKRGRGPEKGTEGNGMDLSRILLAHQAVAEGSA